MERIKHVNFYLENEKLLTLITCSKLKIGVGISDKKSIHTKKE